LIFQKLHDILLSYHNKTGVIHIPPLSKPLSPMHVTDEDLLQFRQYRLAIQLSPKTERIIIGTESGIRNLLSGIKTNGVYCEIVQPLGTLLLSKEELYDWQKILTHIDEAHNIMLPPVRDFFSKSDSPFVAEAAAKKHLETKLHSQNPLAIFLAICIWYGYWPIRDRLKADQYAEFFKKMTNFTKAFEHPWFEPQHENRILLDEARFSGQIESNASNSHLALNTIIVNNIVTEYVVCEDSFIPLFRYYSEKLKLWKAYAISCKHCGKWFAANSLHHELCSKTCKATVKKENSKKRLKNEQTHDIDKLCNATNTYWLRRLNKIRKDPTWTEDEVRNFEIEREHFQTEKSIMRKKLKQGEITPSKFKDWLYSQQALADKLIEDHQKK